MTDEQTRVLADAIIKQALTDLMFALRDNRQQRLKELYSFFRSSWCELLVAPAKIDGIVEKIEKAVPIFIHKAWKAKEDGVEKFQCPICRNTVTVVTGHIYKHPRTGQIITGWRAKCDGCKFFVHEKEL